MRAIQQLNTNLNSTANSANANHPISLFTTEEIGDLIFYCALGVIVGGRLGYILFYYLFYNLPALLTEPWRIFRVWEGGMSFHGGLIGVATAMVFFAKKTNKHWLDIADFIAPLVPIGLFLGRIGNFINGELRGRIVTDLPWGMIFPDEMTTATTSGIVTTAIMRHPSQLYEAFLEGIVLFTFLWIYSAKNIAVTFSSPPPLLAQSRGKVAAWFLLGYGAIRFFCEFFREPDHFIGFVAFSWITMGQLLSLPMIAGGLWMLWRRNKRK